MLDPLVPCRDNLDTRKCPALRRQGGAPQPRPPPGGGDYTRSG